MENKELNKVLKKRAVELGLCKKWQREWDGEETRQELIEKFLMGMDFCLKNRYPRKEFIVANFPEEMLRRNGVFVDEDFGSDGIATYGTLHAVVLLGRCRGRLRIDGYGAWTVYVADESDVEVSATGGALVFVELWHDGKVTAEGDEESRVRVYERNRE